MHKSKIAKIFLKKSKLGLLALLDIKTYYKPTGIKTWEGGIRQKIQ